MSLRVNQRLRRASAAAALFVACAAGAHPAAQGVDAFLIEGEMALRRNDATQALAAFEQAASLRHDATAEWGLVRSWMQRGEYRRALAFAAHAADGHGEMPEGAGLYAWLLHIGGQTAMARRALGDALAKRPGDAALLATERRLQAPGSVPDASLLRGAARQGPEQGQVLPPAARAVASGLLLPSADRALVPALAVQGASALWVRDAMGRSVPARAVREVAALGLVELALDTPMDAAQRPWPVAERDPFPGSPESAIEFAVATEGPLVPAWPLLHTGFVGRWLSDGHYRLGVALASAGVHGGPVYDGDGRLTGLAMQDAAAAPRLLAASALRAHWPQAFEVVPAGARNSLQTLSPDAVYERAMRQVLQVIVLPG